MIRLPKQIKVRCPSCNGTDLLTNQRPVVRDHKVLLACNKCRTEMHVTEAQIDEWKHKASEFGAKGNKKK